MKALWLALALLLVSGGVAFAQDACDYFYQALAAAPHEKLTHRIGELQGQHDGKWHQGCEMVLTTDERLLAGGALPDFQAGPGSESYRAGWRDNLAYSADGPGTSLYAIERGGDLCIISSSQPAAIEGASVDGQGTVVQSATLTLTVQCLHR